MVRDSCTVFNDGYEEFMLEIVDILFYFARYVFVIENIHYGQNIVVYTLRERDKWTKT